jgi:hypothetical protein
VKPAAGYRPLAYSSPEPVQTTGTVAQNGIQNHAVKGSYLGLNRTAVKPLASFRGGSGLSGE